MYGGILVILERWILAGFNLTDDTPPESVCLEAFPIYTAVNYNVVLGLIILFNIFGVSILGVAFRHMLISQKLHFNLRILMINVSLGMFIRSFATTLRATDRIIRAVSVTSPCGFPTTLFYCAYESGLQSIPFAVVNLTFPFICLERFIATFLSKKYETKACFKTYFIVIILVWGYAIYDSMYMAFTVERDYGKRFVSYCSTSTSAKNISFEDMLFSTNFLCPFCCGIIFIALCYYCRWKKRAFLRQQFPFHSLTHRYQLTEVIRTTQITAAMSIIFSLLFLGQVVVISILLKTEMVTTQKGFSVAKEVGSLVAMPTFVNIFGISMFLYLRPGTKNIRRGLGRNDRVVAPKNETEAYFNLYANSWR